MKREQILLTWWGMAFMAMAVLLGCSGSNNQQNGDENEIEIEYSVCTPSSLQCKDLDNLEKCNETGDGWLADKTCGSDEYCKKDACIKYTVCKPETLRCKNAEFVEKCGAGGDLWVLYKRCRSDEQCSEGNCVKTPQDGDEETDQEIEQPETDAEEQLPCACPGHPEMALVEMPNGDKYCIDRYEATVFENPDCTGKVYGQQEGDWPEDFPVCVGCDKESFKGGCDKCEETEKGGDINSDVYPCSLLNIKPAQVSSFFQAYFSCKNVGKELCKSNVWEASCSNDETTIYPYGNEFNNEKQCNEDTPTHSLRSVAPTGTFPLCTNHCGVYDLMGNMGEFVSINYGSDIVAGAMGTQFSDWLDGDGVKFTCEDLWTDLTINHVFTGFRCCLNNFANSGR